MFNKKLYQNKEWLYNKYWGEILSQNQIAKMCGVSQRTIWWWLKRFNISCRSCGEGHHLIKLNHCNLLKKAIDWFNGELLGDGCVYSQSIYSAKFAYESKHDKYIKYISKTLKSFGIKKAGKMLKRIHNNSITYSYSSLNYIELLDLRKNWYPNGKKIVPRNIKLTSLTCRQWYIGDGSLSQVKGITLSTNGFQKGDVEWLVKQLNNLSFLSNRRKSDNAIYISIHSTKAFLDYIGKCPVKCYEYKWAY